MLWATLTGAAEFESYLWFVIVFLVTEGEDCVLSSLDIEWLNSLFVNGSQEVRTSIEKLIG